jgi:hypothetical protein
MNNFKYLLRARRRGLRTEDPLCMKRRGHDAGEENSDDDRGLYDPRTLRATDQKCMAHWNHGWVSVEGVVARVALDLGGIIESY